MPTGVFFNGRQLTTPTTASAVNDSAMANKNLTVGNVVCLIGHCTSGQPKVALNFGDPSTVAAILGTGELAQAVIKAFNPSDELESPSSVIAVRVDPATQATLNLGPIIVNSIDYGLRANQVKIKVEAGTDLGFRVTTQLGNSYTVGDDINSKAFNIQFVNGGDSATMTVNGTHVILATNDGYTTTTTTIDLTIYSTVQELADYIGTITGWTCSAVAGAENNPTLGSLDPVTSENVLVAYTETANVWAVLQWLNSSASPFVTGAVGTYGTLGYSPFTYLTGGTLPSTDNGDWSDCFAMLQTKDVQWITPLSSSPSIWAMTDAHVQYMSSVGKRERRAIVGDAIGTTDAAAAAVPVTIGSDRTSYCHLGYYDYDSTGKLVLLPPYMAAAVYSAAFAAAAPGVALTNVSMTFRGVERDLVDPLDTDPLIKAGVFCILNTDTGFRVAQSISTWLTNNNYNRVEQSTGAAVDFVQRNVRNAVEPYRGKGGSPAILGAIEAATESVLRACAVAAPNGPGVLVGDATNPAYKNITVGVDGDVFSIQYQASPVIPGNFILCTMNAVPYAGSVSQAAS